MEALPNVGHGPSWFASAMSRPGYLEQPEMVDFIAAAVELGWTLVGYESAWEVTPVVHRDAPHTRAAVNHREDEQAANLAVALDSLGPDAPLLVWCGNSHHAKVGVGEWEPMGARFMVRTAIDPFCIDQLQTVSLGPGHRPATEITPDLAGVLDAVGGTAGFLKDDPPRGYWVPDWVDAVLLSTDNDVLGEPPTGLPPGGTLSTNEDSR